MRDFNTRKRSEEEIDVHKFKSTSQIVSKPPKSLDKKKKGTKNKSRLKEGRKSVMLNESY